LETDVLYDESWTGIGKCSDRTSQTDVKTKQQTLEGSGMSSCGYVASKAYQGVIFWQPRNLWPYIYADLNYTSDKYD